MMSDAESYLKKLQDIQNSNFTTIYTQTPVEPRFIIDTNTRTITVPSILKYVGVEHDHNAETVFFILDRYFDNEDLSTHTCVIHYINAKGSPDVYPVTLKDLSVDGKLIFGWKISNHVTDLKGIVTFAVRFYTLSSDGNTFDFNLNTTTASFGIQEGLDVMSLNTQINFDLLSQSISQLNKAVASANLITQSIKADALSAKSTIDNAVLSTRMIYKEPVSSFSALSTTYPNAEEGWVSKVLGDSKIYRYTNGKWEWRDTVSLSTYDALYSSLNSQIASKASQVALEAVASGSPKNVFATVALLQADAIANTTEGKKCTYVVTADGKWYYWNGLGSWISGGIYQSTGMDREYSYGQVKSNLINNDKINTGYYVDNTNGKLVANASWETTDYIPVKPNQIYVLSIGISSLYALYDSNKNYISGGSSITALGTVYSTYALITIPNNSTIAYLRTSTSPLGKFTTRMIVEGNVLPSSYESFEYVPMDYKIESIDIKHLNQTVKNILNPQMVDISVKNDGSGNFISLRTSIDSITDASATKIYNVNIYEGTYDILSDYTSEEIAASSFVGLTVPDYVYLKGIGRRENIILNGSLDTSNTTVSTLNLKNTSGLENITVTANNLRYTIHDDYADTINSGYRRNVKNCIFKKMNSIAPYYSVYGGGCRNGCKFLLEDCILESDIASPFSMHNNINFTIPAEIKLKNCIFKHPQSDSIVFGSMGSGTKDKVIIEGCSFARLKLKEEVANSGVGCDWNVTGSNNSDYVSVVLATDNKQHPLSMNDECIYACNASTTTITKGMAVKRYGYPSCVAPLTDVNVFYGIALQDITPNGYGIIKTKGYINGSEVGLASIVEGQKVGTSGSTLLITTGTNYIGKCDIAGYFKLI